MGYSSESTDMLDLSAAFVTGGELSGDILTLHIDGVYALGSHPENNSPDGDDMKVSGLKITFEGFALKNVSASGRRFVNLKNNTVREVREHSLYKSKLAEFTDRLVSECPDIFSLEAKNGSISMTVCFDGASDNSLFEITAVCSRSVIEWNGFGEARKRKKLTLKDRAVRLAKDIPALFLALGKKETPAAAKMIAALAVGYALSPLELIPDFIPLLGYLDDILILPGLIAAALRLIPPDVMDECRKEAAELWKFGLPKRWFYALPVVLIWLLLMMLVIGLLLRFV